MPVTSPPILLVDDDRGLREILEVALTSEGYEVIAARDGLAALDAIEQIIPAVVLLDWMMPRMDGPSFAAELDRRGLRARIPILLLTAANGAAMRAAQIQADAFLSKPFELPELLDTIDRLTHCGARPG